MVSSPFPSPRLVLAAETHCLVDQIRCRDPWDCQDGLPRNSQGWCQRGLGWRSPMECLGLGRTPWIASRPFSHPGTQHPRAKKVLPMGQKIQVSPVTTSLVSACICGTWSKKDSISHDAIPLCWAMAAMTNHQICVFFKRKAQANQHKQMKMQKQRNLLCFCIWFAFFLVPLLHL